MLTVHLGEEVQTSKKHKTLFYRQKKSISNRFQKINLEKREGKGFQKTQKRACFNKKIMNS
jgi:hypothetical protein